MSIFEKALIPTVRHSNTVVSILIFVIVAALSVAIFRLEQRRRVMKMDLVELSKVKYGIFNVDEWKRILASIITKKVEELNFDPSSKHEMRRKISALLTTIIDDFEKNFYRKNSGSFGGILKSFAASSLGAFDDIRSRIPAFTDNIIAFLEDPENKKAIRNYILSKLESYTDSTFAKMDYSVHDSILKKYNVASREEALKHLSAQIHQLDQKSKPMKLVILTIAIASISWVLWVRSFRKLEISILLAISLTMLITGLLLPMIEIDARIATMSFTLLGENVSFTDQVLYYKSKSILEVVTLMLNQSRFDVLVVGVLVLVFSVLFPVAKQLASVAFIFNQRLRTNGIIRFMVFKTGKWSMADVMVIAIFMSYIGFSGIITEQLDQIENMGASIEILTTNKSSLLTGFFFFTSFAVFSLAISQKIEDEFSANAA